MVDLRVGRFVKKIQTGNVNIVVGGSKAGPKSKHRPLKFDCKRAVLCVCSQFLHLVTNKPY